MRNIKGWLPELARLLAGPTVPLRHRLILLGCTLIAISLFGLSSCLDYREMRQERFDRANSDAQKLLIAFMDHAAQQLDYADSYLRMARRFINEGDSWNDIRESLHQIRTNRAGDYTGLLAVTDRDGKVVFYSDNPDTPPVSLADRDYFKTLHDDPRDRLLVDYTRVGKLSGKMQYRLIRPILRDGKFDGVILVSMLPESIIRFYGSLSLGPHSVSTMMTLDRYLIARAPAPPPEAYGRPIVKPGDRTDVESQPSGTVNTISPLDGEKRQVFYSLLGDYPLLLAVGVSERDVLDSLDDLLTNQEVTVAGFSAGTILVAFLILRLLAELSERRQAANALRRLNSVHQVLSGSNQAVLRASSEEEVYQAMCEAIVTHGGYRMAWIGLAESDEGRNVRPVASAGHVDGYLNLPSITWGDSSSGRGPAGQAIQTGQPQINRNFTDNPAMGPWRKAALERGYRSSIGLPLRSGDGNFGALNIYADEPDAFGSEEVALFVELAEDLSHGVMALRLRRENDLMASALVQAQKMQALGNLTGGIAHDFNNLLQVILSNLDLGLQAAKDLPLARYLDNALQGAEHGAKLTGQLLAFARRQPLTPSPLKLDILVEEMASLLQRTLGAPIHIVTEAAPNLWTALADANQLRNAVLNLAINARDAMPDGGKLTIGLNNVSLKTSRGELTAGDYVSLSISDTGMGMTAEVMSQAFDPFFTTKPEGSGTGLGLSMVYGFVKQSGGHITIDSALGLGTCVTLYLPRTQRAEAVAPPPDAPMIRGQGETILMVEDEDGVRQSVQAQLIELGYRVLPASSSDQALDILAGSETIDLLFTDLVMPGLFNGHDLAVQGRSLRPGLKVLFTSGYAQASILEQGQLDDGITLLGKPYRQQQLAETIHRAIHAEPQRLLLVEDDELVREAMIEILESHGFSVLALGQPLAAAAALDAGEAFSAVIADLNLPGMSGLDLLKKARAILASSQLILITGQNLGQDELKGLPAQVLHKPFHPRSLLALLSQGPD
ncbi:MAG TPA: response regulator [Candidatus Sulfotelmatobacter sp.]|nr:response regulator [Candidatus Sulfotelmatobacter sp.]